MEWTKILENTVYLLALLNPASKVLFLSTYEPSLTSKHVFELSWKSSLAALGILVSFAIIGQFVLKDIFRIDMYSLKITGGFVLFFVGWTAVNQGRFFQKREHDMREDFNELSIVPLAAPLIAGPGTITVAISFAAEYGHAACITALTLALALNFVFMLFSLPVGRLLRFLHLVGPLIRITGLIVAAVAAIAEYGAPLLLVDMGTATTITAVDETGTFVGGCICPGVKISMEALTGRTAQLPGISLDEPQKAIGKNTRDCMRSGIMFGAAAMLDGLLDRMEAELGTPVKVVATGGIARFVIPLCRRELIYDRSLMLKGLGLLYRRNAH
mgnify:CR=1 FL=1